MFTPYERASELTADLLILSLGSCANVERGLDHVVHIGELGLDAILANVLLKELEEVAVGRSAQGNQDGLARSGEVTGHVPGQGQHLAEKRGAGVEGKRLLCGSYSLVEVTVGGQHVNVMNLAGEEPRRELGALLDCLDRVAGGIAWVCGAVVLRVVPARWVVRHQSSSTVMIGILKPPFIELWLNQAERMLGILEENPNSRAAEHNLLSGTELLYPGIAQPRCTEQIFKGWLPATDQGMERVHVVTGNSRKVLIARNAPLDDLADRMTQYKPHIQPCYALPRDALSGEFFHPVHVTEMTQVVGSLDHSNDMAPDRLIQRASALVFHFTYYRQGAG
jgi:hypothetical protein